LLQEILAQSVGGLEVPWCDSGGDADRGCRKSGRRVIGVGKETLFRRRSLVVDSWIAGMQSGSPFQLKVRILGKERYVPDHFNPELHISM